MKPRPELEFALELALPFALPLALTFTPKFPPPNGGEGGWPQHDGGGGGVGGGGGGSQHGGGGGSQPAPHWAAALSAKAVRATKPTTAGSHVLIRTRMGRPSRNFARAPQGVRRSSRHQDIKSLSFPLPSPGPTPA